MSLRKYSLVALGSFGILGCNDAPPAEPVAVAPRSEKGLPVMPRPPEVPAIQGPDEMQGILKAPQPKPTPVEPVAKLPDDLGGKAVQKSLMPSVPAPADIPPPKIPRPRTTTLDQGELPSAPQRVELPPGPNPKVKSGRLSPPSERAPGDLGQAAAENLSTVRFAEKPLVKVPGPVAPGASDVPMLARQLSERTPIDDPTAEISAAKLIDTAFPLLGGALPFLKQTIPDPFEFAEQLKGKSPRDAEFGIAPTTVPPERK